MPKALPPARSGQRGKPAKGKQLGRKRDKHKKSEQESSQTTITEEPEQQVVDEATLLREKEEARRRWLEEQRKKYPVAPDGFIPNSVVRGTLRVHKPNNAQQQTTKQDDKKTDWTDDILYKLKINLQQQEAEVPPPPSKQTSLTSLVPEKRQKSANQPKKSLRETDVEEEIERVTPQPVRETSSIQEPSDDLVDLELSNITNEDVDTLEQKDESVPEPYVNALSN